MDRNNTFDVKEVLGNLGSSNEARLKLLERRMTVPPSPATSADAHRSGLPTGIQHNGNSMGSTGSGVQQSHSSGGRVQTPQVSGLGDGGQSREGADGITGPRAVPKKRAAPSSVAAAATKSKRERSSTPTAANRPSLSPFLNGGDGSKPGGSTPGSKGKPVNTISRYFAQVQDNTAAATAAAKPSQQKRFDTAVAAAAAAGGVGAASSDPAAASAYAREAQTLREQVKQLQDQLTQTQEASKTAEAVVARLERECAETKETASTRDSSARELMLRLATESAQQQRELTAMRLQQVAPRLGFLSVRRRGIDVQEVWEDGDAFRDLQRRLSEVGQQREAIETARKASKRRLPLPGQPLPTERHNYDASNVSGSGSASGAGGGSSAPLHPDDWVAQEEIYRVRLAALKREEDALRSDLARLEVEKTIHVRELKRVRDEEGSRFNNFPVLNNRYLLLNLLGRGGFSEVYRALDLTALRSVGVKVHQLSSQWSEAKKASYVKHSVREYHIHRQLHHPRIVSLLDIFEIDNNTFATVLELCTGGDLDAYMRSHETLPEREARAVIAQVLSALCYLNTKPRSVIHYDLKPANILFDARGEVKVTDFGLSKVVEEGHTQGMELTSQGAGTYWYLPPECFDVKSTPLISNKVDVWSLGVILYQMLYGRRPFGHDQSQEQILRNEVMLNAREVQFPSKPSVSAECKDFIKKCLAYRQEERMDVHAAAAHQFMAVKKDRRGSTAAAAAKENATAPLVGH